MVYPEYGDEGEYVMEGYNAPNYEYDDVEEVYGDINIEDEYYPDDGIDYAVDDFDDGPWLPYTPPAPSQASTGNPQQQVVLAGLPGIYPPTADLTDSYCRFYPKECARNQEALPRVNTTCIGGNGTEGECQAIKADKGFQTALGSVDLSGFGMVLMIALLLFIGIHFAWDGDKPKGKDERSSQKDPKSAPKADQAAPKDGKDGKSGKPPKDAKDTKKAGGVYGSISALDKQMLTVRPTSLS